jgi:type VI secretion system protein ImpA
MEVMRILVPAHAEQATIYLGSEQVFELPIERLSGLSSGSASDAPYDDPAGEEEKPTQNDATAKGDRPAANGRSSGSKMEITARQDALALLDQVGVYYRVMEPSSPIPLLTERARSLAERDFLGLLKDVLPGVGAKPADD